MSEQPATRIDAHFIAAGKYHDIDYPRLEILKLLAEHPHIRTTVAADYSGLELLDQCRFLITYTCDLMPTREQALAMLARVLAEPATMFARAVKAVADKQGGGEAAPEAVVETA